MTSFALSDVLVLSPTPSHPHDFGNRKRIYEVCAGLKRRGARISFVHYPLEADWRGRCPAHALAAMRAEWDDVHVIAPSVPIHAASKGLDHALDEWWDPALEPFLRWYFASRHFDAMLVNYVYLSRALMLRPRGCLGILDTHDKFSGRRQLLASIGIGPEFFHITEQDERTGLERADLVLAIKEQEQALFQSRVDRRVLTLPYAEPSRWIDPPAEDPDGYLRIGLLGARNNLNVFNIRRFLEVALPHARSHIAPLRFVLAGSMCTDLAALFRGEGLVDFMGHVGDVADFYRAVDLVVVPMDISSGQKIKIGEALGFGVPLISHAHAFEGYSPSHRLHSCSSFQQMAEACIDVSFNREMLTALSSASRRSAVVQLKAAEDALDTVAETISAARRREVFVVDANRLVEEPFLSFHILSMGHLVSSFARVTFLLIGDIGAAHRPFLADSRPWSQCYVTGERDEFSAAEGVEQVDGLNALLRTQSVVRAWLYDECELDEITRREIPIVAVRHLMQGVEIECLPASVVNACGFDFVSGVFSENRGRRSFRVLDCFPSAAVDGFRARAFHERHTVSGRPSIWIIASPGNEALVRTVVGMLLSSKESRDIVLIGSFAGWQPIGPPNQVRVVTPREHRRDKGSPKPELIVDLSSRDDEGYLFAAMFEDGRIPILRPSLLQPMRGKESHVPPSASAVAIGEAILRAARGMGLPEQGNLSSPPNLTGLYNRFVTLHPALS